MPLGPWLIPAIGAVGNIASNIVGGSSQRKINRDNINFQWDMYGTQRRDALTDMHYQNQYNSPEAQMQRLKAAGLNPNLVYGSGAIQQAAPTRSSGGGSPSSKSYQPDFSGVAQSLMMMYDIMSTKAKTDNLKAQAELLYEQQKLTREKTTETVSRSRNITADTEKKWQDISITGQLAPYQLEALKASVEKTKADTAFTLHEDERKAALQSSSLAKAVQEVVNMRLQALQTQVGTEEARERIKEIRQRLDLMFKDGVIRDYDIQMRRQGMNPGDPGMLRFIKEILAQLLF